MMEEKRNDKKFMRWVYRVMLAVGTLIHNADVKRYKNIRTM